MIEIEPLLIPEHIQVDSFLNYLIQITNNKSSINVIYSSLCWIINERDEKVFSASIIESYTFVYGFSSVVILFFYYFQSQFVFENQFSLDGAGRCKDTSSEPLRFIGIKRALLFLVVLCVLGQQNPCKNCATKFSHLNSCCVYDAVFFLLFNVFVKDNYVVLSLFITHNRTGGCVCWSKSLDENTSTHTQHRTREE